MTARAGVLRDRGRPYILVFRMSRKRSMARLTLHTTKTTKVECRRLSEASFLAKARRMTGQTFRVLVSPLLR